MYSLIYTSKATDLASSQAIYEMLATARIANKERRITGCLLFHQRRFVQLLEGEKPVVKALYEKIVQDPMHTELSFLGEEVSTSRIFDQWNMAFHEFDEDGSGTIFKKSYLEQCFKDSKLYQQGSSTGLRLFKEVRQLLE